MEVSEERSSVNTVIAVEEMLQDGGHSLEARPYIREEELAHQRHILLAVTLALMTGVILLCASLLLSRHCRRNKSPSPLYDDSLYVSSTSSSPSSSSSTSSPSYSPFQRPLPTEELPRISLKQHQSSLNLHLCKPTEQDYQEYDYIEVPVQVFAPHVKTELPVTHI